MRVWIVRCDHGDPLICERKEDADEDYQTHLDSECNAPTLEEGEMSEEEYAALPEHDGW